MNSVGLRVALAFRGISFGAVQRDEGQTLAEYALILALIAAVTTAVILTLGDNISSMFSRVASAI